MERIKEEVYFSPGLDEATGEIPEKLTNDIILHSVTQNNKEVLRGLTAALLMVPEDTVTDVELLNPIDYRDFADKKMILDIKALINRSSIVNVELQMVLTTDSRWWINRSLLYLCRTFDNVEAGREYSEALPSVQVCIVPKDMFSDAPPEFYAQYMLMNDRNGHIYTRDFSLRVLYLNHTDLATETDKKNGLDFWAKAFLATTWEELKSLAKESSVFREVAESMYTVNADVSQRSMAEAHRKFVESYENMEAALVRIKQRVEEEQQKAENEQKKAEAAQQEAEAAHQEAEAAQQEAEVARQEAEMARQEAEEEHQRADAAEAEVRALKEELGRYK